MADRGAGRDSRQIESYDYREPHLEVTQDLELLAQEIAEAAVEEERKLSRTPSPSPSPSPAPPSSEAVTTDAPEEEKEQALDECEDDLTDLDEETSDNLRSNSPVDEASWVLVDAVGDEGSKAEFSEKKFSVYRKFLARGDLRQKLADLGLTCDSAPQASASTTDEHQEQNLQNLVVSCSESMVICDFPQEGGGEGESSHQVFIKDSSDTPRIPSWKGTVSGATVSVEVERQGGLLVAAVTVWHLDLLSALTSLRDLVSSAGLVSYADVDVPSLLARAA